MPGGIISSEANVETVLFGDGLIDRNKLVELIGGRKHIIIIDEKVCELYQNIFSGFNLFRVPSGEGAKTLEVYERMISACNVSYLTRGGVVVAVGGGAALDAGGFLASTYMRGVSNIKIPTTLIAMCDAAIGGKTALNTRTAKNEIGTFYEAECIVVDVAFLRTLPKREFVSGMGEVVKYAMGFEPAMLEMLARWEYGDIFSLSSVIRSCIGIKQRVVELDFGDAGSRKTLNFGHTLGHAVEFASGFEVSHGEAVAIGCHHMAVWANREGTITDAELDLIDVCYENLGLSRNFDAKFDKNIIFSHILSDKKMRGDSIDIIKLQSLGKLAVQEIGLDALYSELFKGPKLRLSLEEQWRRGVRFKNEIALLKSGGSVCDAGADAPAADILVANAATADILAANAAAADISDANAPAAGMPPEKILAANASAVNASAAVDTAVIELPVSKSFAHRYLILAAFADTPTAIERFDISDDLGYTIEALKKLSGAKFDFGEDLLTVVPRAFRDSADGFCLAKSAEIDTARILTERLNDLSGRAAYRIDVDCGSSASTARFLIPFSWIRTNGAAYFYGSASLENRPMHSIVSVLKAQGVLADPANISGLPLCVLGKLKPGIFRIGGDTSSQFLSGLLMAAPLLGERSRIVVAGEQVSMPYVDITLRAMLDMGVIIGRRTFGVGVGEQKQHGGGSEINGLVGGAGYVYDIEPASYYSKGIVKIEKDYSQAAFWLVAETLRQIRGAGFKKILLPGLNPASVQGDRVILDILGVRVSELGEIERVVNPKTRVDLRHCPDLFPILAVFFALNGEGGVISGVERVTYKESDRFEAMVRELSRIGCRMSKSDDGLVIYPGKLVGRALNAHDDHRVAMALIILGLFVDGVTIDSAASISKSYPKFAEDLAKVVNRTSAKSY